MGLGYRALLSYIGALLMVWIAISLAGDFLATDLRAPPAPEPTPVGATNQDKHGEGASAHSSAPTQTQPTAEKSEGLAPKRPESPEPPEPSGEEAPPARTEPAQQASSGTIAKVELPYPTPPESFLHINERARAALVNIFCTGGGSVRPVLGSGVVIDPRGVILTNAHVAQYVLLAESGRVNLSCMVRSGSPARPLWNVEVLYLPQIWLEEHAKDITKPNPTGTGEHDYALLHITGGITQGGSTDTFSYLPIETRNGITFPEDPLLVASYPAELVGGIAAQSQLYPVSSITPVRELLTFGSGNVDLVSLGGIIGAQSGSSGGGAVNAWGYLVGIITTTSDGATTAERDLRALTLSYIDRDIEDQTSRDLATHLSEDPAIAAAQFGASDAPELIRLLLEEIQ